MIRKRFTPAVLAMKAPAAGRVEVRDDISPLILRVSSAGNRAFVTRARIKGYAQPIRLTYPERPFAGDELAGLPGNVAQAREWAVRIDGLCRQGVDPRAQVTAAIGPSAAPEGETFKVVAERFKKEHVATLRSAYDYEARVDVLAAQWGTRPIRSVTSAEIHRFFERRKAETPIQANRLFAALSKLMSWYQLQVAISGGEPFTSPIIRGMKPTKETARERVLGDNEIAALWRHLDGLGTYGAIAKLLFLTGQRKGEVAQMRHSQINASGQWVIPASLYKNGRAHLVPLPPAALDVIRAQDRIDDSDLVFSFDGKHEFSLWSRYFGKLEKLSGVKDWRLHDIRRTARSLMSRAGVQPDHAERAIGHSIAGIRSVYDHHEFLPEKTEALRRLALTVGGIVGLRLVLPVAQDNARLQTRSAAE